MGTCMQSMLKDLFLLYSVELVDDVYGIVLLFIKI